MKPIAFSKAQATVAVLWHRLYIRMYRQLCSSSNSLDDVEQKYKNIYHNLPQITTLLISFTTFDKECLFFGESEG
jgi:hypothetical protein